MNLNNIINILNHQTLWFFSKKVGLKLFKPTFSSLNASQMLGVFPLSYICIVLALSLAPQQAKCLASIRKPNA